MNLFYWIEDQLDKLTPKVEVHCKSKLKFASDTFDIQMKKVSSELPLKLRSKSSNIFTFNFSGRTAGTLSQAKVFFGKEPKPEMYKNMKSKLKCTLTDDGTIEVLSYEHMAGLGNEREVFKEILTTRLNLLLTILGNHDST